MVLRALIVETGKKISPFGDAPGLALYAATTVGDAVRAALARRGIPLVTWAQIVEEPAGPTLVLADHAFVSDKCLGDFLDHALNELPTHKTLRLALAHSPSTEFMRPVSSVAVEPYDANGPGAKPAKGWEAELAAADRIAYDCFLADLLPVVDDGNALLAHLRAKAVRIVVPKRELGIPIRMPVLGNAQETKSLVPVTSTVACHVEHWVHILWLNQLAFGIRWMEIARAHKLWVAWRALLSFPYLPLANVMRSFVRKGKRTKIHPTAHVEASILGDDVVIGARASVRNSILGNGAEVGDHATLLSSTLGDRGYVTPRTFMVWTAAYPDAVISNYKLQVSVVGRGASLSTWAGLLDAKLQGNVEVVIDGKLVSTERSYIGSCIGHGAHVGAKVLIMPGREIPNGAFIAMRPDELILDVPRDLPAGVPLVRDKGTLVKLE